MCTSEENTVVLPCHAGTLVAKTVQDDESDVDAISIELMRPDGTKEELALFVSTEKGITFSISIPMRELDPTVSPDMDFPEE